VQTLLALAFLSSFAGGISIVILVGMGIARMIHGPRVDPDPPPVLRRSYVMAILVTLAILGIISFAGLYVVGSALASL
jgi:hypothetical protein